MNPLLLILILLISVNVYAEKQPTFLPPNAATETKQDSLIMERIYDFITRETA